MHSSLQFVYDKGHMDRSMAETGGLHRMLEELSILEIGRIFSI